MPDQDDSVLEINPYDGHPNLSELEAEVLWQYAKLAQNIKEVYSGKTFYVYAHVCSNDISL